jgi:putative transposase
MPKGLKRYYGRGHLHFITSSCYRRSPMLGTAKRRDLFVRLLEQVRIDYQFDIFGYVAMPEHFHLLMSEPAKGDPSVVMQVLKQTYARELHERVPETALDRVWQRRFYDFNVFTRKKQVEKNHYMHNNPVKRGLVAEPEEWRWSSYRFYALDEVGPVTIAMR